jgi:hypothetical protein
MILDVNCNSTVPPYQFLYLLYPFVEISAASKEESKRVFDIANA